MLGIDLFLDTHLKGIDKLLARSFFSLLTGPQSSESQNRSSFPVKATLSCSQRSSKSGHSNHFLAEKPAANFAVLIVHSPSITHENFHNVEMLTPVFPLVSYYVVWGQSQQGNRFVCIRCFMWLSVGSLSVLLSGSEGITGSWF